MATFSVKCPSDELVKEYRDNLKRIIDENSRANTRAEALGLAFQVYFTGIESLSQQEISQTAQDIITSVDCRWLDHDGKEYLCRELFHKKKKTQSLGEDATKIPKSCASCRAGRTEQENEHTRKLLKGRTNKTFTQITKFMSKIVKSGMPGDITFCNRLDPPIGTGMQTIFCSKHDQSVEIDKVCKDPPCKFIEQYHIKIHSEFAEKALAQIESIATEYQQLEGPPTKDINVEQEQPHDEP